MAPTERTGDRYQKRAVSPAEIAHRIQVGDPEQAARLILAVSPCRSGTTILLRVFSAVGIESHYQQIKNILRWRLQGGEMTWQVPQGSDQVAFLKETLGPYTEAESTLNPLEALLDAGFLPDRLHVLIVGRAPLGTWASWDEWWGELTAVDKLILAYRSTEQVAQQAEREQIARTTYVYEALRDNPAEVVVGNCFARLGLPYAPIAVEGWHTLPPFEAPESRIRIPDEPPIFMKHVPNIHDPVMTATQLSYLPREASIADLAAEDIEALKKAGLPDVYEKWRKACEEDLKIQIKPDPKWDLVS
ncbi:MAG TPA: hypothetical protein ENN19_04440 [Chloroflexi bacterium]|nr:hypothetical protein [Chloroflexota bacterium]